MDVRLDWAREDDISFMDFTLCCSYTSDKYPIGLALDMVLVDDFVILDTIRRYLKEAYL